MRTGLLLQRCGATTLPPRVRESVRLLWIFPSQKFAPGEILIAVKAAGVAFHDGLQLAGKHQIKHEMPYVTGTEIAGEVSELGDGVYGPAIGTRVMALNQGNVLGAFANAKKSKYGPFRMV